MKNNGHSGGRSHGNVGQFVVTDLARPRTRRRSPSTCIQPASTGPLSGERTWTIAVASSAAFEGCEAIVHLAAIAEAGIAAPEVTFQRQRAKVRSTPRGGGRRWGPVALRVRLVGGRARVRLPRARLHARVLPNRRGSPAPPQDCYGVGKLTAEEACRSYCRAEPSRRSASDRVTAGDSSSARRRRQSMRDPGGAHHRSLWVYIHLSDIARRPTGSPARSPTGSSTRTFYAVPPRRPRERTDGRPRSNGSTRGPARRDLGTYGSLIANDRAREMLGFTPVGSWRDDVPPSRCPPGSTPRERRHDTVQPVPGRSASWRGAVDELGTPKGPLRRRRLGAARRRRKRTSSIRRPARIGTRGDRASAGD